MIIDAEDKVMGRVASHAAEHALLGKDVHIVNSEQSIITGDEQQILEKYRHKRERGAPRKGPFFPKHPARILKRTIRGMLPYKKPRGEEALSRVKCHVGVPNELEGEATTTVEEADVSKLDNLKYIRLKRVSEELGATV